MLITVLGHDSIKRLLVAEDGMPQVVSFMGPKSVGKRTLAIYLKQYYCFSSIDFMEVNAPFTAEKASQLRRFALTAPFDGSKLAVVHLDGATDSALNDALKLLEEPPEYMYFILISSEPVLPTVLSRAQIYRFGTLNEDDLCTILTRFEGLSETAAKKVSYAGQVSEAKEIYQNINARNAALAVLKSVETQDVLLFKRAFKAVDDSAARMLESGLFEACTGDWRLFSPEELPVLAKKPEVAQKLLEVLGSTGSARRSLSARVVLEQVVRRG